MFLSAWIVFGVLVFLFALGSIYGAPFLPTNSRDTDLVLELLNLAPGQRLLDIGVGNGAVLIAAAKRGIKGIGYEINPIMYLVAKHKSQPYKNLIEIKLGNYWRHPLPKCDGIYAFLITKYMPKLDAKITAELTKPTPLVCLSFKIPGRRVVKKVGLFHLYHYA